MTNQRKLTNLALVAGFVVLAPLAAGKLGRAVGGAGDPSPPEASVAGATTSPLSIGGPSPADPAGSSGSGTPEQQPPDLRELVTADLSATGFSAKVGSISEDAKNYYVDYEYATWDIVDNAWQPVNRQAKLTVAKRQLKGRDLGLYVEEQLAEVQAERLAYLKQVKSQAFAEARAAPAGEYSVLLGAKLTPQNPEFAGYQPVVHPPEIPTAPALPQAPEPEPAQPSSASDTPAIPEASKALPETSPVASSTAAALTDALIGTTSGPSDSSIGGEAAGTPTSETGEATPSQTPSDVVPETNPTPSAPDSAPAADLQQPVGSEEILRVIE